MSAPVTVLNGLTEPAQKVIPSLDLIMLEERQVILHSYHFSSGFFDQIRIHPHTCLIDLDSGHRSLLLQNFNISLAPQWTPLELGKKFEFTLVFAGLPKDCTRFDMLEDIPGSGRLHIHNIQRNKSDVYYLRMTFD
jgi:hypothetical protein